MTGFPANERRLVMANGHGGWRPNSGRKKRPLAEKILEGHPGKRKPQVLDIQPGEDTPVMEYPEELAYYPARIPGKPTAQDIWERTVAFLKTTGCLHLIHATHIEYYAIYMARAAEAERFLSKGMLVYEVGDKTKEKLELKQHPAVDASIKYMRMSRELWSDIWNVVLQNSTKSYDSTPHDDLMQGLLAFNRDGK